MMVVVLDFDGTIVDVWVRYYQVFCEAIGVPSVDFCAYKTAKLFYQKDEIVARELGLPVPVDYFEKKRQLLELRRHLMKDTLLIAKEDLLMWFRETNSVLLTKRRNRRNLFFELDYLGLREIKNRVVVLDPDAKVTKKEWALSNLPSEMSWGYVIGDSDEDLLVGEVSGMQPLFVKSGLRLCHKVCPQVHEFEHIGEAFKYIKVRGADAF